MLRHLFALLLLTVLGLGLFAGPHPCKASHPERENRHSCHAAAGSSDGPEARKGAPSPHDGQDCCNTFCQHACHCIAVTATVQMVIAIVPVSPAIVEASVSGLPLFASPIDHIPLA